MRSQPNYFEVFFIVVVIDLVVVVIVDLVVVVLLLSVAVVALFVVTDHIIFS